MMRVNGFLEGLFKRRILFSLFIVGIMLMGFRFEFKNLENVCDSWDFAVTDADKHGHTDLHIYSPYSADKEDSIGDCDGLAGMRVLLTKVHMEGNLGDELETTPLLKELKRCKIVTISVLSYWIGHPDRLSARSVREHSLMDEIIS